ncbi:MAG: EMC3/TMCO1 family protein [Promethearchaeota archaeon]
MANEDIIIQIMLITIGMVGLSEILNRIFGLNMEATRELREKSKNLQERMRTAKSIGNPQEMLALQRESLELSKDMMKKQMIPSCIRCAIFMGIFAVLQVIYADYTAGLLPFPIIFGTGWFTVYFLFSITFSLIIYGFKRLYRKLTGKDIKRKRGSGQILGGLRHQSEDQEQHLQLTRSIPNETMQMEVDEDLQEINEEQPDVDSWKDRIKK